MPFANHTPWLCKQTTREAPKSHRGIAPHPYPNPLKYIVKGTGISMCIKFSIFTPIIKDK